ncbi:MAG TPA: nuclear transport factor 2 family protein [Candidatus Methanofastidiosa archaeon]|nr:nuclear transport factor 2 family protein [Candidatus Methanofastidiosa archaeon]HPR41091.1 nuclear transport factor 2 family protein [Candidatus Methanofastidiosa archaeon]
MKNPGKEDIKALESVALKYVEAINNGDSESLVALQAEDFTFIDVDGVLSQGKINWKGYFSAYPKYKIHILKVLTGGNGVAIIGKTTGSHVPPEIEEKETVIWTAEIRDGLIVEWRIYTDARY